MPKGGNIDTIPKEEAENTTVSIDSKDPANSKKRSGSAVGLILGDRQAQGHAGIISFGVCVIESGRFD
jgi:hypothetical protein